MPLSMSSTQGHVSADVLCFLAYDKAPINIREFDFRLS